jgi:SAM-dependent methyltransferase
MTSGPRVLHRAGCAILAAGLWLGAACAQASDVPYVPTPMNVVEAMLELGAVRPDDFLIDLGSGDGRILITAAKRIGVRGFGVDLDDNLVRMAQREAERQGVSARAKFHAGNLFDTDIIAATVITMYLLPAVNLRLRPRLLQELKPGTRIVSHDFDLDAWEPDARRTLSVPDKSYGPPSSEIFLWVVPAEAAGRWRWRLPVGGIEREYFLGLEQTFQKLQGAADVDGRRARFGPGRMKGSEITFSLTAEIEGKAVEHRFSGRLAGDEITGTVSVGTENPLKLQWKAVRSQRGRMEISGAGRRVPGPQALLNTRRSVYEIL